jgi:hypothetical protein
VNPAKAPINTNSKRVPILDDSDDDKDYGNDDDEEEDDDDDGYFD